MYEVAQVAGNKVEAACALQSLSNIMGQISSSHHHNNNHHHQSSVKSGNTKVYPRHSVGAPSSTAAARLDDQAYRERLKEMYKLRDTKKPKDLVLSNNAQVRPITISEMNAYNVEKSEYSKTHQAAPSKNKEFYSVGEGYHKTENCYYKTPDGGYHKLPPDSFHKMSEICYVRTADGTFRRLDELNGTCADSHNGTQHKMRDQMIRFLKRSKSHTPATIKEMQKAKDKERERERERDRIQANGNRKVVVTMMENGGLPIIATSKPTKREQIIRESQKERRSGSKVRLIIIFID